MSAQPDSVPDLSGLAGRHFDLLFDLAVDLLAVAGLDGHFHRVSRSAQEILGYAADELVGKAFLDMTPERERERVWDIFGRLARGETIRDFTIELQRRDGSCRWIQWNMTAPIGDGMSYMAGRDVTEEREARRRLQASEERLELAIRGAADGLWDWMDVREDAQWWSPRLYQLLGMRDGEIPAGMRRFLQAMSPRDRLEARRQLRDHFEQGTPFDLTCALTTKLGLRRSFRIRGAATRGAGGSPLRMSGSFRDVTEAVETVERLARSEQLLRDTGALAKVGGWEIDADTLEIHWTPEILRILAVPDGERLHLEQSLRFFAPESRARLEEALRGAFERGEGWDLELSARLDDGRGIWVRSQARVERLSGRVKRISGALRDITEQKEAEIRIQQNLEEIKDARDRSERQAAELAKQAAELALAREQAEEAARLKSSFLATMSHEMRTPMNGILGTASLMESAKLSAEHREYLQTIRASGETLLEIINDVLDYSKCEAGKMRFASNPFDLARRCEEAADMLTPKAASKQLDLAVFISPSCPLELRGDPGRLRQVLTNLIGNAVKFTDKGSVAVRVEPVAGGLLRFEVADSGIGIPGGVLTKLFRPFMQADSGATRRFGGTGLGLAICKQIVEGMGGRIGASSEVGCGSTFWIELDLPEARGPEHAPSASGAPRAAVLLVRSPSTARAMREYFDAWGFEPITAGSIAEAAKALDEAGGPGLLLAESGPGGFAVAEVDALRYGRPALRIAVLSWPGAREIEEALGLRLEVLYRPVKRGRLWSWISGVPIAAPAQEAQIREGRSLRVLVAEDNPVNQRIVMKMLERLGHEAALAVNGREALERARAGAFDLILMDCQMPEMDGFQAAREIRGLGLRLPIVALTANALEGDRERCIDAGMDDYLTKPINVATLGDALERLQRPAGVPERV